MYTVYNQIISVLELNSSIIHLFNNQTNTAYKWNVGELEKNVPFYLSETEVPDQLLLEYDMNEEGILYVYSIEKEMYLVLESDENVNYDKMYKANIQDFNEELFIKQVGLAKLELVDKNENRVVIVNSFFTTLPVEWKFEYSLELESEKRFVVISTVNYGIYNLVVTYDVKRNELIVAKVLLNSIMDHTELSVKINNFSVITIHNKITNTEKNINFRKLNVRKARKIFNKRSVEYFGAENILSIIVINKSRYYLFLKRNGIFIAKKNPFLVTRHRANLRTLFLGENLYIYGRFTHYALNAFRKYDYLYIRNSEHLIAKFQRPFSKIKFLKRYGYFKIPTSSLNIDNRIHNNLFVGNKDVLIHNLYFRRKEDKVKTYAYKKHKDLVHVIRSNLRGYVTSTIIPFSEEYSITSRLKISAAKWISRIFKPSNKQNLNLFFEKKSNKADESGFRVYEKVMEKDRPNSKNYFILNKESEHYSYMKEKYGRNIIEKYSFRHFLSIYNADYFIASELSNHVLNDRLYIESLRNKIQSTPLVFLQHGIMFAKPVDNPMAFGFHKDKTAFNVYKTVVSSHLEIGEFKKMNYEESDLILTGLATFDYAKLDDDANKIAFMPTYRYWEEGLIYTDQIEETTYYKTIISVIDEFKKEGLIDQLLIVPHNKFSEFIYRNMPEYRNIISDNPSEALKKSKVFITDYSSAIYDAIIRGAYPIFYWKEKDYLIDHYKAIPPVNEENAPGQVVYDVKSLVETCKQAIQNDYKVEEEYRQKYLKINEFHDHNNTERIIRFLETDDII